MDLSIVWALEHLGTFLYYLKFLNLEISQLVILSIQNLFLINELILCVSMRVSFNSITGIQLYLKHFFQ